MDDRCWSAVLHFVFETWFLSQYQEFSSDWNCQRTLSLLVVLPKTSKRTRISWSPSPHWLRGENNLNTGSDTCRMAGLRMSIYTSLFRHYFNVHEGYYGSAGHWKTWEAPYCIFVQTSLQTTTEVDLPMTFQNCEEEGCEARSLLIFFFLAKISCEGITRRSE
jgi:hypothetical protein